jgi:hypothetical protein
MNEIKALLSEIPFWFLEKYLLRKNYGKSRPNNFGDKKWNDRFYVKLEKELLPFFENKGYFKIKKRIFIKKQSGKISYVNFALNKKLNGVCVDYGELKDLSLDNEKAKIINRISNSTNFQRLKPDFWNYDYQYPVRQNDKYDEPMIGEIKELLSKKIN